jgi:hypothetical protein
VKTTTKSAVQKQHIERLQLVIEHRHACKAAWVEFVPVHEVFRGKTVWKGDVEVYALTGHPKAKRSYGWSYGEPEQFITILELPPVDSAQAAVRVGVAHQVKNAKKRLFPMEKEVLEQVLKVVGGVGIKADLNAVTDEQRTIIEILSRKGYTRTTKRSFWILSTP